MAIQPRCDICGLELTDLGALLFSPPDSKGKVKKYHICKGCYSNIAQKLKD